MKIDVYLVELLDEIDIVFYSLRLLCEAITLASKYV